MKLYIINNARMPTEKAHGYQIAKMCESFAKLGAEVELIVPKRLNTVKENVFDYYGVKENFKVSYLSSLDFFMFEKYIGSKISFYVQSFFFRLKIKNLKLKIVADTFAITRNPELVDTLSQKGMRTFYDAHRWPESKNNIFKKMLEQATGFICNSNGTVQEFKDNGFQNILAAPNGVDLANYELRITNYAPKALLFRINKIRDELNLPVDKKIVMYVGHLYVWKGVEVIIEAAKIMKDNSEVVFVFVGGLEKDVAKYKKQAVLNGLTNIIFCGHQKKEEVPKYQMAADVLLLPNIPVNQESDKFTSPIKMFEYMASGVPIIASSLPSIREVLNENNALLVKADDSQSMIEGIEKIINNNEFGQNIAKQAEEDVKKFTWENRARKILEFINK